MKGPGATPYIVVQIHWGVKGKGFGHNKTCVNGRGGCWNWFSSTIDTTADVIISVDWDLSIHPHVVAIAQTEMLDMLGTTQNCRIPAGIYSVTRNERGNITVILPAFTL